MHIHTYCTYMHSYIVTVHTYIFAHTHIYINVSVLLSINAQCVMKSSLTEVSVS